VRFLNSSEEAEPSCVISLNAKVIAIESRYPMNIVMIDDNDFLLKPWIGGMERIVIMLTYINAAVRGGNPVITSFRNMK